MTSGSPDRATINAGNTDPGEHSAERYARSSTNTLLQLEGEGSRDGFFWFLDGSAAGA